MAHLAPTPVLEPGQDRTMVLNMGPQHPSTHGVLRVLLDIGAMTVFLYCFREREEILKLFEMVSGQRMMTSYFRIGGLALEPPLGFFDRARHFAGYFPERVDEYENLLTSNPIWMMRTKGVAKISAEDCLALGGSGPTLRG